MSDARIRRWVGYAITEGNTLEWITGWIMKLSIEVLISGVIALFLTEFSYRLLGFEVLNGILGVDTAGAVFAIFTSFTFYEILFCEYDICSEN